MYDALFTVTALNLTPEQPKDFETHMLVESVDEGVLSHYFTDYPDDLIEANEIIGVLARDQEEHERILKDMAGMTEEEKQDQSLVMLNIGLPENHFMWEGFLADAVPKDPVPMPDWIKSQLKPRPDDGEMRPRGFMSTMPKPDPNNPDEEVFDMESDPEYIQMMRDATSIVGDLGKELMGGNKHATSRKMNDREKHQQTKADKQADKQAEKQADKQADK
jgi:hypothetical protein